MRSTFGGGHQEGTGVGKCPSRLFFGRSDDGDLSLYCDLISSPCLTKWQFDFMDDVGRSDQDLALGQCH